MDSRGQGGNWRTADTADAHDDGLPGAGGFLTRGILDPHRMYYTRLFIDAARAVEAARVHPVANGLPIVTTGASQGGALSLAATHLAALAGDQVAATMPDVPFLSNFARAARLTPSAPYNEILQFCKAYPHHTDQVFANLSYLDVVNHARRIPVPALFSVGLVDDITPASTVYAAYNHYAGRKQIQVYPFNGHEGGGARHIEAKLAYLDTLPALPTGRRSGKTAKSELSGGTASARAARATRSGTSARSSTSASAAGAGRSGKPAPRSAKA
jgi:cephalosporin-C deacetylase